MLDSAVDSSVVARRSALGGSAILAGAECSVKSPFYPFNAISQNKYLAALISGSLMDHFESYRKLAVNAVSTSMNLKPGDLPRTTMLARIANTRLVSF